MNPNYPIPNSAITLPSQSLNGYSSYPSSQPLSLRTMGVYKAGSTNSMVGGTKANQYFRLITNPFDAAIVSIPDADATAHVLKTIHFNANLAIPTSAGMFVYPTSSPRRNIRWYLFDTATQTMNLLQEITPDEDLPSNYVYGRQISSGVKIYSNTLASGNIALSGTMNAIFYVIAPPISGITPQTLTQYAGDELNSLSGVLVVDGVAGVSPPDGTKPFRTLDTTSTPDLSQPLRVKPNVSIALATPIANGSGLSVWKWSTSSSGLPQPLPWGFMKLMWQQTVRLTGTPPTTLGRLIAQIAVTTYSANPTTGARVATTTTYARDVVISTWPTVPAGAGGGITTTALAYGTISFEVDDYFVNEIGDVEIILQNNALGATILVDTDLQAIGFSMYFYDYYRESLKEPGVIMTYEGVTAGQSFTITGAEHWELVPDNDLTRNIASLYNIDDPIKMEAAMAFLFCNMGNPYRFIYPRSKFEALEIAGKFNLSEEEFALRASSIFDKFKSLWSYVRPYAARAANALITEFTGNPGLAMIGQSIMEGQPNGPTYRASSGFRCTATSSFGPFDAFVLNTFVDSEDINLLLKNNMMVIKERGLYTNDRNDGVEAYFLGNTNYDEPHFSMGDIYLMTGQDLTTEEYINQVRLRVELSKEAAEHGVPVPNTGLGTYWDQQALRKSVKRKVKGFRCTSVRDPDAKENKKKDAEECVDFCTNDNCPVKQIHTNTECTRLREQELQEATKALYVAGSRAISLLGNTEAMRIVFEFPTREVTNVSPPKKQDHPPGQNPLKNAKLNKKSENLELQNALAKVIKSKENVRKGFSCSSRIAALQKLAGGVLEAPVVDSPLPVISPPPTIPQSQVAGLNDPHMSQKQVWATTRNAAPLAKATEGKCKFLKAFIPMVFGEGDNTQVILGHVVVSNCPIVADPKYGSASYRPFQFTRGDRQLTWQIENHIAAKNVHQEGPYVDVDLVMALGFESIYLTIFPHEFTWDTVEGESFELAVASILLGVPCPGMYSGTVSPGYSISDVAVKTVGTTVVGKQLFMSRPQMDEVAEVIKALENTPNKLRLIRPREIFMTTGKPIAFYDDDPAVIFLAANMYVPSGGSLQKVAGVSTPSREQAVQVQEKHRQQHQSEVLYMGHGVYENMTKGVWEQRVNSYLEAFNNAGGSAFWHQGDGPKLLARVNNTAKTDGWWKGVKILGNGYQWLDSKTTQKKGKKKKKNNNTVEAPPAPKGAISSFANRFLSGNSGGLARPAPKAPPPESESDEE